MIKSSETKFALFFALIFLIIGLWPIINNNNINLWSIFISLLLVALIFISPKLLKHLNNLWIKFGDILGKFFSPIIMMIIFFIIITPLSVIARLFKKDFLNLKLNRNNKTFWITRSNKFTNMDNQF